MNQRDFTIKPEARKILKKILIVSGIVALAYMLISWFEKSGRARRPSN